MIKKLLNKIFNRKNVVFENPTEEISSNDTVTINGRKHLPYNKQVWFPDGMLYPEKETTISENKLPEEIETLIADMKRAKALNDIVRDEITKKADDFEKSLKKKKK